MKNSLRRDDDDDDDISSVNHVTSSLITNAIKRQCVKSDTQGFKKI